jgi:hypothetical protein
VPRYVWAELSGGAAAGHFVASLGSEGILFSVQTHRSRGCMGVTYHSGMQLKRSRCTSIAAESVIRNYHIFLHKAAQRRAFSS